MTRYYTSNSQTIFALATSVALCAASFIASAPTPANAATGEATSVAVSTAGYDFSKPSHAKKFGRVIKAAATRVCGGQPDVRDLGGVAAFNRCNKSALANAAAQIGSPVVTAELNVQPAFTKVATR